LNLSFNETEERIRDLFADFFAKESSLEVVRQAEPLGFDRQLWTKLWQTGAPSMAIPEANGGGGATTLELSILAEQFGRHLAPVPLVEHLATTRAIALAGRADLLEEIVNNSMVATLALSTVVNRTARLVPAGAIADIILILDGNELVVLRRVGGSVTDPISPNNFGASPVANVSLEAEEFERIVLESGDGARRLYSDALSYWRLLMAAALNGLGARALEIAVDYVMQRQAFGVLIGSFQAVKHRLADAKVSSDGSALLALEAAWANDTHESDEYRLSMMSFIFASETAFRVCREALQFHGGYGVTLEYDIQLYFRRAKAWPLAIGDISMQYRALGEDMYPPDVVDAISIELS
jgi:alkylation response protein AidB-like acyl-CoA dehydrogenase